MTEMTFDQAEALGYDATQRTDNIAPTLERQVEIMSQRIAELQRLNESKVRTIAEKDDRIVGLVNEVEAMKRQAGEFVDQRERMAMEAEELRAEINNQRAHENGFLRREYRELIAGWANENDLEREFVNTLLDVLHMEPLPEYIEAEIEVRLTVRFEAGPGTPSQPSDEWLKGQIEFGSLDVRPAWGSALTVEGVSTDSHDVIGVVAH